MTARAKGALVLGIAAAIAFLLTLRQSVTIDTVSREHLLGGGTEPSLARPDASATPETAETTSPTEFGRMDLVPTTADSSSVGAPSASESEEDLKYGGAGSYPPTPGKRLWRFKGTLKAYRSDKAKVMDAHVVLTSSIIAILDSQGMAVIAKDEPEVVSEWLKRKGGMCLVVGNQACWAGSKDFPELEQIQPFLEKSAQSRLRHAGAGPGADAETWVPRELDERIGQLADEALKLLEAAAAKAK